jgi:translation initiation factor 3 subunit D
VKNEKPLQRIDRIFHTVTTTDDPVIRKLSKTEGNVYATDAILATLMCCTRSNYSWDIVIEKIGDKLFFDKRDNTEFGNLLYDCVLGNILLVGDAHLTATFCYCCVADLLTVNETSVEPPQDDGNSLNSPRNLALEATFINHNFSQQVLKTVNETFLFTGRLLLLPRVLHLIECGSHSEYSLPSIIRIIKSRRMRWVGHVA